MNNCFCIILIPTCNLHLTLFLSNFTASFIQFTTNRILAGADWYFPIFNCLYIKQQSISPALYPMFMFLFKHFIITHPFQLTIPLSINSNPTSL